MSTKLAAPARTRIDRHAVATVEKPVKSEKRKSKRVAYEITMQIAPYDGTTLPDADDFQPVVTRDLSPTGISFYTPAEPTADQIVLMVGDHRQPSYVTARVVRSQQGYYQRKRQYLIGCAFTGRIDAPQT